MRERSGGTDLVKQDKKLRIGYYKQMEFYPGVPSEPERRRRSRCSLEERGGHEVFEVEFPNIQEVAMIYLEVMTAEGNARMLTDPIKGEASIEEYDNLRMAAMIPEFMKSGLKNLLTLIGEARTGMLVDNARKRDVYEYGHLIERQNAIRKAFLKVWEDNRLDALAVSWVCVPCQQARLD